MAISTLTTSWLGYDAGTGNLWFWDGVNFRPLVEAAGYATIGDLTSLQGLLQTEIDSKLDSSSYTASDVLTKIKTVDGSGSGLDADHLDGQDGGYYTNIVARLGYTPFNAAGGTIGGNTAITGTLSVSTTFTLNNLQLSVSAGSFFVAGTGKVWTSDNDGSGSGLDADTLDGQDSGYFTNITARLGYTPLNAAGGTVGGNLTVSGTLTHTGGGRLKSQQAFIANGTWTKPTGVRWVFVYCIGGGGGGGGAQGGLSNGACGAGGGAGGVSTKWFDVSAISSVSVTVGSGGTAGSNSGGAGGTGGTSSFGAHCSADGGTGGQAKAQATSDRSSLAAMAETLRRGISISRAARARQASGSTIRTASPDAAPQQRSSAAVATVMRVTAPARPALRAATAVVEESSPTTRRDKPAVLAPPVWSGSGNTNRNLS